MKWPNQTQEKRPNISYPTSGGSVYLNPNEFFFYSNNPETLNTAERRELAFMHQQPSRQFPPQPRVVSAVIETDNIAPGKTESESFSTVVTAMVATPYVISTRVV